MTLRAGERLGPYEIIAPLGAGGMGEVFRARDTRLEREVAIKVLPERVAGDRDALSRFEREAKAVAALSHPNILAIHDFGRHGDTAYAVMELLDGEALRSRLDAGALPPRKAVEHAAQVARGLAAAHDRGIVHRDLKPENLFFTKDGQLKILDFGLAAQRGAPPAGADGTSSPTVSRYTDPGMVLGTAGYMSPEQVRGHSADHRSDIFAFGCVLYEMLSGSRAFRRETAAETMAAILKEQTPALPPAVAAALPGIERLLEHCLEKRPEERFQSARDLGFHLQSLAEGHARSGPEPSIRTWRGARVALPLAALLVGIAAGAASMRGCRPQTSPEPAKLRPLTFSGQDREPSSSPDGRLVAFSSRRDGRSRIWIKQIGSGEAPLTDGADHHPRFAPDGSSVLFLRVQGLKQSVYRVALVGGEPRQLVDDAYEAEWSPDGQRIAYVKHSGEGTSELISSLRILDLRSGKEDELLPVQKLELIQPRFSPDGRSVTVIRSNAIGNNDRNQLLVVDVASRKVREVIPSGYQLGCLAASGDGSRAILARAGSVVGDTSGAPSRVFDVDLRSGEERGLFWAAGLFPLLGSVKDFASCDVLSAGKLVFDSIQASLNLSEIDLASGAVAKARSLTQGSSRDRQPAYSPDGRSIVFSSNRSGNLDLWVLDQGTGALRQLTDDPAQDWDPGFTPDGKSLLWSSDRSGNLEIWTAARDGSGARQVTRDGIGAENPTATPDGAWIVYSSSSGEKPGIWKVRADGRESTLLVAGRKQNAEVSPDGRYAAFVDFDYVGSTSFIHVVEIASATRVPFEVRVVFPAGNTGNLTWGRTRWMPDGKRLIFIGADKAGLTGVFVQDFVPGQDTTATRRQLAGFSPDFITESLGLSPDGRYLTIAQLRGFSSLWLAEGLPGVEPPRRGAGR